MATNTCELVTDNAAATEELAARLGAALRGGEVIELISDLGGGKTTFTRGLVRGSGSSDNVASPTFTISKVYKTPKFDIHHFDFYRLTGSPAGLAEHELHDLLDDTAIVIVVEWSDVVAHVLPDKRLQISISSTGEEQRKLTLSYDESLAYLLEDIC